jgi:hypothetical protein
MICGPLRSTKVMLLIVAVAANAINVTRAECLDAGID